ncbi:flagellar basal body-associated protein FliL [Desulfurivibrio sp. D14AmB]|uniref:flagellar basal body-associated FliL family protein n=1 Tax=Desulfurivibrio sp. D14AmB TaxID=3374370 RepID=UPI00376F35F7
MAEEKEAPQEGEEAPKKKSKIVFFAILGAALLLLGGGGFFAYLTFLAPPPVEQESRQEIGEILSLEPFVVNLADPTGKRYLKIQIQIELENPQAVENAERAVPRLRDNVIMMMTALSFEEVMTPEGKIRIRDELLERFNVVLRPDRVRNIYFTEFVVQ